MMSHPFARTAMSARVRAVPVSMPSSRLSPIFNDTTCAPGATPFSSVSSGWYAATMPCGDVRRQ